MVNDRIKQIIEALLFSTDRPLPAAQLAEAMDCDEQTVLEGLGALKKDYADMARSFTISEIAGGYQITSLAEFAPFIKKLYKKTKAERLSGPALETLAIIAYRQPLTRAEIEAIRGVNVDGVMATLVERGLIRITGRKDAPGRPFTYGTSREFLQTFGLSSLKDLPELKEFKESDIEIPQEETKVEVQNETGTTAQESEPVRLAISEHTQPEGPADASNRQD